MSTSITKTQKRSQALVALYAAIITFLTYATVYGFRKGFTVCTFDGISYAGISYKTWLVVSQVVGYMLSKFYGIRFISELKRMGRGRLILILTGISWSGLFLFAIIPAPYNIVCMFINGFPLGMIWGVVFSFVEGRKATDFIGAALAVSFIFSSGFVKSVAKTLEIQFHLNELWVPFFTGLAFAIPLILFVYLLEKIPPPSDEDVQLRTNRVPMTKEKRKEFVQLFFPGLVTVVIIYVFSTIFRDLRDNFMADMLNEMGLGNDPSLFTKTETPTTLIILIIIGSMVMIRNNFKALMYSHYFILLGFVISGISSYMFVQNQLSPIWWMTLVGLGLYMTYIPFNCIFFERVIATFKFPGNVGFLIYVADSFGYLGSVGVLITKEFLHVKLQWTNFYSHGVMFLSIVGVAGTIISLAYFSSKYKKEKSCYMDKRSAIVVGAGIVGLATARALALKGFSVKVFERTHKAVGASIRNFGMIWPIGQPSGKLYDRAIRSRNIWKEIGDESNINYDTNGSLHLAYHADEWQVLQELYEAFKKEGRDVSLLNKNQIAEKSEAVIQQNLLGGLFSNEELIIDPRQAIHNLPEYLSKKFGIEFHWGKCVTYISDQTVYIGNEEEYEADLILICSGADFETLYPEQFAKFPFTKCKLQMLRLVSQPDEWRIGPSLCGGLSLIHYKSFTAASSLPLLKKRYENEMQEYLQWGIHVMVSQNTKGELTVGDSHEYAMTHDPFDKDFINKMVLDYLKKFVQIKDWTLSETWNGIYPKLTNGETDLFFSPEPGVHIINGVGGAGMTLSFGLAEELIEKI